MSVFRPADANMSGCWTQPDAAGTPVDHRECFQEEGDFDLFRTSQTSLCAKASKDLGVDLDGPAPEPVSKKPGVCFQKLSR